MAKKILYADIQLNSKVWSPNKSEQGEITAINNMASLAGVNEPIFTVKFKNYPGEREHFGLKYIQKMIVQ